MFGFKKSSKNNDSENSKNSKTSLLSRLKDGLSGTRKNINSGLSSLFLTSKQIDDELLEEIETLLITADLGIDATTKIITELTDKCKRNVLADSTALYAALRQQLLDLLVPCEQPLAQVVTNHANHGQTPFVILMAGINGAGKTTSIGKICRYFQQQGKSVMLAAGDTFRAAAVQQLKTWGERHKVPVIAQHDGADSASVIFDALESAKAKNIDILIADTAGRLHTQSNLMEELKKIKRVLSKLEDSAPQEVMLVVDAGTGQNALNQAVEFDKALNLTGITLTKLDGTAKGGVIFAIAHKLKLPIRFIGVGEQAEDLREFNANDFIDALFDPDDNHAITN
ncbi:Signal recognition particle receptor FtsY [hydrothermal vent metagenome]|uniref:Signal recognition particle receptor FtsY n=1 Tax=hydrothermal vent metagenome TaxID=652676 RepID=A0A3B1ANV7_9ZZZZ